jgi:hypothetical protein
MKIKRQKLQWMIVLLSATILSSCWYNRKWENLHPATASGSAASCDTSAVVSYSATVQPIVAQQCALAGCHGAHPGPGATNYTQFANVAADASLSNGSPFMARIDLPTNNSLHMPQGGGFVDACDTLKIRKWIHAGCPQN